MAKGKRSSTDVIRDRVVELRRVKAADLREHPENWRIHPEAQADALGTVLTEIGFAGAVLAYQDGDALVLVDGHLRRDMAGDTVIPVLVTDLTPDEADALLAVYDPIADMAEVNRAKQAALLERMAKQGEAFKALAETVGAVQGLSVPDEFPAYDESVADEVEYITCPHCGEQFPK